MLAPSTLRVGNLVLILIGTLPNAICNPAANPVRPTFKINSESEYFSLPPPSL